MRQHRLDLGAFELAPWRGSACGAIQAHVDGSEGPRKLHDKVHLLVLSPSVRGAHAADARGAFQLELGVIDLAANAVHQIEQHSLLCASG
jgi:hypothetical protein